MHLADTKIIPLILFVNHFIIYMVKMYFVFTLLKRRYHFLLSVLIYTFYAIIVAYLSMYIFRYDYRRAFVECGVGFAVFFILFKDNKWKICIAGASVFFVSVFSEMSAFFTVIGEYDLNYFAFDNLHNLNKIILVLVLINIYTVLIYSIILKPLKRIISFYSSKSDIFISLYIFVEIVSLYFMLSFYWNNKTIQIDSKYIVIYLILLAISLVMIILVINNTIVKEQEKSEGRQEKIVNQYNLEIITQFERLKLFRHDYISQLQTIYAMLINNNSKKAIEFIEAINLEINKLPIILNTGNEVADALLYYKVAYCKEHNIRMDVSVKFPSSLKISDVDLNNLIANSINNAIKGCEDFDDKYIIVETKKKGGYFVWIVKNPSNKYIDGDLATSNIDIKNHGLGTKILKIIAKKYGGDAYFTCENCEFVCMIYLRNSEDN